VVRLDSARIGFKAAFRRKQEELRCIPGEVSAAQLGRARAAFRIAARLTDSAAQVSILA